MLRMLRVLVRHTVTSVPDPYLEVSRHNILETGLKAPSLASCDGVTVCYGCYTCYTCYGPTGGTRGSFTQVMTWE
jgi:hypothetical protein